MWVPVGCVSTTGCLLEDLGVDVRFFELKQGHFNCFFVGSHVLEDSRMKLFFDHWRWDWSPHLVAERNGDLHYHSCVCTYDRNILWDPTAWSTCDSRQSKDWLGYWSYTSHETNQKDVQCNVSCHIGTIIPDLRAYECCENRRPLRHGLFISTSRKDIATWTSKDYINSRSGQRSLDYVYYSSIVQSYAIIIQDDLILALYLLWME